jgi:hypothetical protein
MARQTGDERGEVATHHPVLRGDSVDHVHPLGRKGLGPVAGDLPGRSARRAHLLAFEAEKRFWEWCVRWAKERNWRPLTIYTVIWLSFVILAAIIGSR